MRNEIRMRALCKEIRVHTHTRSYTRTRAHTHTHKYTHSYSLTHTNTSTHIHTHTHTHTHTRSWIDAKCDWKENTVHQHTCVWHLRKRALYLRKRALYLHSASVHRRRSHTHICRCTGHCALTYVCVTSSKLNCVLVSSKLTSCAPSTVGRRSSLIRM